MNRKTRLKRGALPAHLAMHHHVLSTLPWTGGRRDAANRHYAPSALSQTPILVNVGQLENPNTRAYHAHLPQMHHRLARRHELSGTITGEAVAHWYGHHRKSPLRPIITLVMGRAFDVHGQRRSKMCN